MVYIAYLIDFLIHIDKYLSIVIQNYGAAAYFFLFLIIFLETGLVITPFLPGDSLIFIAGAFAARGDLNLFLLFFIISLAAIIGDSVNYWIGKYFGEKIFSKSRLFREDYLKRTKEFYEKYGGKTIIMARFAPIIRTFAPFVAGVGKMDYKRFFSFNVFGGILWTSIFVFGGYYLGGVPFVEKNLTYFIYTIVILSFLPPVYEYLKAKRKKF